MYFKDSSNVLRTFKISIHSEADATLIESRLITLCVRLILFNGGKLMKKLGIHLKKTTPLKFAFIFLVFITASALALEIPGFNIEIPGMNYGRLKRDKEVTQIFETYKVLPDHKYYTSGLGNIPYAIIGIHETYTLRKGLWKEVNLTTQLLRSWTYQMDTIYGYPPYGSKILDDNGKQVGIWYSSKQWTTVIMEEDNGIALFTPEPPGFRGGK